MSPDDEKKKTQKERLAEALAEARADAEIERLETMTDEEVAKELADGGVDMEEEERRMAALLEKHGVDVGEPAPPAEVVPIAKAQARRAPPEIEHLLAAGVDVGEPAPPADPKARRALLWIAVVVVAVILGIVATAWQASEHGTNDRPFDAPDAGASRAP